MGACTQHVGLQQQRITSRRTRHTISSCAALHVCIELVQVDQHMSVCVSPSRAAGQGSNSIQTLSTLSPGLVPCMPTSAAGAQSINNCIPRIEQNKVQELLNKQELQPIYSCLSDHSRPRHGVFSASFHTPSSHSFHHFRQRLATSPIARLCCC